MISARSGRTEVTDILLTGENIDPDIQENVRLHHSLLGNTIFIFMSLPHRTQDGQLSSSLLREEMSPLQNHSSKQEPVLTSRIR